jgi:uncharacterized protein (DUF2236 family)
MFGPMLARELRFPEVDLTQPAGEPGLVGPSSVSWRVFRNPVAVAIGGIAAVLLELGEPRVRSGVWEHSDFRRNPKGRMRRTALGAMITVYGPVSLVEKYTNGVNALHASIGGTAHTGQTYRANEPELLRWVQVTATYAFGEAFHRYVRPLSLDERDRFVAEAAVGAAYYGVADAPRSNAELQQMLVNGEPSLTSSPILAEFLNIIRSGPILPFAGRVLQPMLARAAIDLLPANLADRIGCSTRFTTAERGLLKLAAAVAERVDVQDSPWSQALDRISPAVAAQLRS